MRLDIPSASAPGLPLEAAFDRRAFTALRRAFAGELILPDAPSYATHRRVWNGSVDRYPALIARCTTGADIQAALTFVRRTGLTVAVRGGGHSFPGLSVCDGGVVVDLRPMNRVRIDTETRRVRVGAGTLLGELDAATQTHGLAVPAGAVSHTGVAGLTLGGGIGWLMRKLGLTIDQLISVELVTAAGDVLTGSLDRNADLFWGVRGGGGNLGIVTDFEFRAHAVGPLVLGGVLLWPLEDGDRVARAYRDWAADAPDESMSALVLRKAPALDFIPRELHGRPIVAAICCWSGDLARGEAVLRPLRDLGRPVLDTIAPTPLVRLQSLLDPSYPHGLWAYVKACDLDELSDEVIAVSLAHAERAISPRSGVIFWQVGGAVSRVAPDATAFGSRGAGFIVNITGATDSAEGYAHEVEWTRAFWGSLAPYQAGVYVNFLMEEGEERVRQAYGTARYERLGQIKRAYDPQNLFRLNQNVVPGSRGPV